MSFIVNMDEKSVWVSDGSAYPREHALAIVQHYRYAPFSRFSQEVFVIDNGIGQTAQEWMRHNA